MTPFTLANLVLQQHNSQASVVNRHLCPTALRKTCGGDDALKFIGRRREPAWIDNGRLRNLFSLPKGEECPGCSSPYRLRRVKLCAK